MFRSPQSSDVLRPKMILNKKWMNLVALFGFGLAMMTKKASPCWEYFEARALTVQHSPCGEFKPAPIDHFWDESHHHIAQVQVINKDYISF
jgi:hypothetical protein